MNLTASRASERIGFLLQNLHSRSGTEPSVSEWIDQCYRSNYSLFGHRIVFSQEKENETKVATILLRASTGNILSDVERAIGELYVSLLLC